MSNRIHQLITAKILKLANLQMVTELLKNFAAHFQFANLKRHHHCIDLKQNFETLNFGQKKNVKKKLTLYKFYMEIMIYDAIFKVLSTFFFNKPRQENKKRDAIKNRNKKKTTCCAWRNVSIT